MWRKRKKGPWSQSSSAFAPHTCARLCTRNKKSPARHSRSGGAFRMWCFWVCTCIGARRSSVFTVRTKWNECFFGFCGKYWVVQRWQVFFYFDSYIGLLVKWKRNNGGLILKNLKYIILKQLFKYFNYLMWTV
jgi:hypothetical protein